MAHSHSTEYSHDDRIALLEIAREAIATGCDGTRPAHDAPHVTAALERAALAAPRNCFVTLKQNGGLRGCIGSLAPRRALVIDVAENAFNAAFQDPRFRPMSAPELATIDIHIAVLSPQTPIDFTNESGLLNALRPYVDGLTIEDGPNRATFLPKVWEQLPEPGQFLAELKAKAGMPANHWSAGFHAWRYHSEDFSEEDEPGRGSATVPAD